MPIQRGSTIALPIKFTQYSLEQIDTIDFIFKKEPQDDFPTLVTKHYGGEGSDVIYDEETGYFIINLSEEDTYKFPISYRHGSNGELVYLGIKMKLTDGSIPPILPIRYRLIPTLFAQEEEGDT